MKNKSVFLKVTIILLVLFFINGCANEMAEEITTHDLARDLAEDNQLSESGIEKIIKEGIIYLDTKDVKDASEKITKLLEKSEGFVEKSTFQQQNDIHYATMILRIDSAEFDSLMDELSNIADVTRMESSTLDVTEKYIDLRARIDVLEAQEQRLIQLLDQADNIEEIINIEKELTRLRENIESSQGRMNYLERAIDYSKITVYLQHKITITTTPDNIITGFLYSFQNGWNTFVVAMVTLLNGIFMIWPFIILLGVFAYFLIKKIKN
ncbi:DUF4349 domain-containing protein [Natranaerofaba carboxydovora]|uniref:DUF4349 domain-containing protein n=1 Tax=Natranaerofaba carboxydovora TaxID=2742683 RepID=UPI001F137D8A|nr:DUF4349 domain-containing protein [Natranaerofaba carboxydovora]UMZ73661.1 hypothetical protein ACONDI_01224 [Natranaerofaba carboxydovora]